MDESEHKDKNDEEFSAFPVPSQPVEQHGPPAKVKFIGEHSAQPRLNSTSVPDSYQAHPLIKNQFFYTIPEELLQKVCQPVMSDYSDLEKQTFLMELELSKISGDHGSRIGFWGNVPIQCNLMHSTPLTAEEIKYISHFTSEEAKETVKKINKRLLSFAEISCAYAGWLMTNPNYIDELNNLCTNFSEQMQRWGTASVGIPISSIIPNGVLNPTKEDGWKEYDEAVLKFCIRWRLLRLAGPMIPIPMQPMMGGQFPILIVKQLMNAGGVFNWPDTFPLYARDELRDLLADALQTTESSEHLAGWKKIIAPSNKAKNKFGSLERHFRFQHFWRLLRNRHPQAFDRRLNKIEIAFAEYFGVDESTIHLDRSEIKKSIGSDWDVTLRQDN